MHWVIDTEVLACADRGKECHDHFFNVQQLLGTIRSSGHFIVVDHEGEIEKEYRDNLTSTGWVYKFLNSFSKRGKVLYLSGRLANRLTNGLRHLQFDPSDYPFVAVAKRDSTHLLVAEESDYTESVVEYLSGEGVQVVDCAAALAEAARQ